MTADKQLYAAMKQLQSATDHLNLKDAIKCIDEAIESAQQEHYKSEFIVHKAMRLWFGGERHTAIDVLKSCCENYSDEPSASFYLGEYLIEEANFSLAAQYLSDSIASSLASGDSWYLDSAYLLHAYASAKSGDTKAATGSLAHVTADESISWLDTAPLISKESIQAMMN